MGMVIKFFACASCATATETPSENPGYAPESRAAHLRDYVGWKVCETCNYNAIEEGLMCLRIPLTTLHVNAWNRVYYLYILTPFWRTVNGSYLVLAVGFGICQHSPQFFVKCDRLQGNPAYGIRALFAQCAFLVAQVEICRSPGFVIYMSNNPSNCCRRLRRLVDLYNGEISLHFDPPSRPSCRTRSPLLWTLIRILYLDTARFIKLLYVRSPF